MRLIITVIFLLFHSLPALAGSYVSETQGTFLPSEYLTIGPGEIDYILLPSFGLENGYEIDLDVTGIKNNVNVGICSEIELQGIFARSFSRCRMQSRQGKFRVKGKSVSTKPYYLVLDNRKALFLSKTVRIDIFTTFTLESKIHDDFQLALNLTSIQIQEMFLIKSFDINFISCKMVNAFSTVGSGDITLCSELLFDVIQKNNTEAFLGIMAHEMSHSFMGLWGSPHAGNEKSADEMAIALIFIMDEIEPITKDKTKPETNISAEQIIRGFIEYFDNSGNLMNEVQAANLGDQHQLSVQRVNNIRAIMMSPASFVRRWTKDIYPHLTVHSLNQIIAKPHIGANISLANNILQERQQKHTMK